MWIIFVNYIVVAETASSDDVCLNDTWTDALENNNFINLQLPILNIKSPKLSHDHPSNSSTLDALYR